MEEKERRERDEEKRRLEKFHPTLIFNSQHLSTGEDLHINK